MDDNQIATDEPKAVWIHAHGCEAFHGLSFPGSFDTSSCMFPNARAVVTIDQAKLAVPQLEFRIKNDE